MGYPRSSHLVFLCPGQRIFGLPPGNKTQSLLCGCPGNGKRSIGDVGYPYVFGGLLLGCPQSENLSVLDQEDSSAKPDNQKNYPDDGWNFAFSHGAVSPEGVEVGVALAVEVGIAEAVAVGTAEVVAVGVGVINSSDGSPVGVGVKMFNVGIVPSAKNVLPSILPRTSSSRLGLNGSMISGGTEGEGWAVKAR